MSSADNSNDKTQIASLDSNSRNAKKSNKLNLIGKKISDRYFIEELIGQGGMCYIYRARDLFLESTSRPDTFVAIKVLLEEFSHSEEAITLLKDETIKTQQLSHPNIVKVYSAGSDNDLHYVTMELVEGETLEQIIKRNKPSGMVFKKAKIILNQLADALIYAHSCGVIHNDLKPSNIIFDTNGNLKVLDFGIAKHKTIEDIYAVKSESNVGVIGGYTPTYASPEQLKGANASVKDDVFSYGCIALELLSSKHPYNRVAADKVPKGTPLKRPSHCPLWLWSSLKNAIALESNNRSNSLQPISNRLNFNFKTAVALAASAAVLALVIGQFYVSSTQDIKQLEVKLDNASAINQQVKTWMSWNGPTILEKLDEIPPQYNVLKQGLLKANQDNILQSFEARVNSINSSKNKFKDFDQAIDVYSKALEYYPDSEKLSVQLDSILRERQSIISDITARIDLLLAQSRYNELDNNSIPQLVKDLHEVDSSYIYSPTEEHIENYKLALNKAIDEDDAMLQMSLLNIGTAILTTKQKKELGFATLLKRESAIEALTAYQEKVKLGEQATFPKDDAIVFYGPRFEKYSEDLSNIDGYKELLNFEAMINDEFSLLPNDFVLLTTLKQELSKRYITMAGTLMKKRMYQTAEQLVERSQAITESLDSARL